MKSEYSRNIVLFDGICNLCNYSVHFIMHRTKENFLFLSLQSSLGKKIVASKGLDSNYLKTLVFIHREQVFQKSDAILEIGKRMKEPWAMLSIIMARIPKRLRDKIYQIIAQNRYIWFGKKNVCTYHS